MPCKTLKNDSPRPRIRIPRKTTYPSYLYRRGQFFIFNTYSQNDTTNKANLRVAKELAQRLRQALNQMIGMLMDYERMDYSGLFWNRIRVIFPNALP